LNLVENAEVVQVPEGLYYIARHCGLLSAAEPALRFLRCARLEGFWSSLPECEIQEAQRLEARASEALHQALGSASAWLIPDH
jgi:hypothetical protein